MYWASDWIWGIPLLVVTIVGHVCGLVLMEWALIFQERRRKTPRTIPYFIIMVAMIALVAAGMHSIEAGVWALVYTWLGAAADLQTALLYSLGAITSYGHANIGLRDNWRLLGAIEAMNGLILFGLTTAFLFGAIAEIRPVRRS
ncbi:hypothetical protein LG047_00790 [Methylocystis sp. WRRC1]|uniref:hypothetical protein n=1 Tax=unclassified Methylocystis TaxID=2625913 RepID=UPI00030E7027|nr:MULTISPECIES: hypothetical protein [unclassified Methylocystis]MCC3243870.1 hypothetical protein [Methylocystis sp. WRRC1]